MSKKISRNKPTIEFPKEIRELAQKFRQQRQARRLEKQKNDEEQEHVRVARLKTGLKYATKVFLWAKDLKESDIGQELRNFIFFDGRIVGVPWVGLGINPKGLFLTRGGRFAIDQPILTRGLLAEAVETVTLQMAGEWIDNGEVWKCIKRHFDYLNK